MKTIYSTTSLSINELQNSCNQMSRILETPQYINGAGC